MIINKKCISAFSSVKPYVALATKSKVFDNAFELTSELILINYKSKKRTVADTIDSKFTQLLWCESKKGQIFLVGAQEEGGLLIYEFLDEKLNLVSTEKFDNVLSMDYFPSRNLLCVVTISKGNNVLYFYTFDKLIIKGKIELPSSKITSVAWNQKVSGIMAVGTSDGEIKIVKLKTSAILTTLKPSNKEYSVVKDIKWDFCTGTKIFVRSEKGFIFWFDLANDQEGQVNADEDILINGEVLDFSLKMKEQTNSQKSSTNSSINSSSPNSSSTSTFVCEVDVIVSKNSVQILTSGIKFPINESFDCHISPINNLACLSTFVKNSKNQSNTQIIYLPTKSQRNYKTNKIMNSLFIRKENYILDNEIKVKIEFPSFTNVNSLEDVKRKEDENDLFYDELISIVSNSANSLEIGEYLLSKCDIKDLKIIPSTGEINAVDKKSFDNEEEHKKSFDNEDDHDLSKCDTSDNKSTTFNNEDVVKSLIMNEFTKEISFNNQQISCDVLYQIIKNNNLFIKNVNSFIPLILISKIFNDYTEFKRISNIRILSAMILYYGLNLKLLKERNFYDDGKSGNIDKNVKEAKILYAILSKDQSEIANNRIVLTKNIYKNLNQIWSNLCLRSNENEFISSQYLIEYFWFKVLKGEYQDVKDLKVKDCEINSYKENISLENNPSTMNNMNSNFNMNRNFNMNKTSNMNRNFNNSSNINTSNVSSHMNTGRPSSPNLIRRTSNMNISSNIPRPNMNRTLSPTNMNNPSSMNQSSMNSSNMNNPPSMNPSSINSSSINPSGMNSSSMNNPSSIHPSNTPHNNISQSNIPRTPSLMGNSSRMVGSNNLVNNTQLMGRNTPMVNNNIKKYTSSNQQQKLPSPPLISLRGSVVSSSNGGFSSVGNGLVSNSTPNMNNTMNSNFNNSHINNMNSNVNNTNRRPTPQMPQISSRPQTPNMRPMVPKSPMVQNMRPMNQNMRPMVPKSPMVQNMRPMVPKSPMISNMRPMNQNMRPMVPKSPMISNMMPMNRQNPIRFSNTQMNTPQMNSQLNNQMNSQMNNQSNSQMNNKSNSQMVSQSNNQIIQQFDQLVFNTKENSKSKNSIILNQRKQNALNAIKFYENMDNKENIPIHLIKIMKFVIQRVNSEINSSNPNYTSMINDLRHIKGVGSDTVWINGLIQLIMIVYQ